MRDLLLGLGLRRSGLLRWRGLIIARLSHCTVDGYQRVITVVNAAYDDHARTSPADGLARVQITLKIELVAILQRWERAVIRRRAKLRLVVVAPLGRDDRVD